MEPAATWSQQHDKLGGGEVTDRSLAATATVCRSMVDALGVSGVAVAVLADHESREMVHATDPVVAQLDELQFTLGEGPCLDAFVTRAPVLVPDLGSTADAEHWPGFAQAAVAVGARAVFAFPLVAGDEAFGVVEMYRRVAGGLSVEEVARASLMVDAAVGVVLHDLAGDDALLSTATMPDPLFGRPEVHQAAGMLSQQLGTSVGAALARLRAAAFADGVPINELARDVLARRLRLDEDSRERP